MIHFDPAMPEEDECWSPVERETLHDIGRRVNEFLDWLVKRPETHVVVVSHGVWLECCFHAHSPETLQNGDRVYNCDLFAAECLSENGKFLALENVRRI